MTFGDPTRFAIEFELDLYQGNGPDQLDGHLRYLIGGDEVGDFQSYDTYRNDLPKLDRIVDGAGRRKNEPLLSLGARDLVTVLSGDEDGSCHDVRPAVGVFEGWKVFLVEGVGRGRIVAYHPASDRLYESRLRAGEFDEAFAAFRAAMHEWRGS